MNRIMAHEVHRRMAMTPRRTMWTAVLVMLAMVGTPLSALAVHSTCEVQHHPCDETVADLCCCGHLTGAESQQPVVSNPSAVSVAVAALPAASPVFWAFSLPDRHELVPHVGHLAIDRLVLFRVLLI